MSQAAHASFYSYLSPTSHFCTFLKFPETHYKIIRAADPVFDTIEEIAKAVHAPESTLDGLSFGRSSVKTLRQLLASFYLFTGVLPSLIFAIKLLIELIRGLFSQKDVLLSP